MLRSFRDCWKNGASILKRDWQKYIRGSLLLFGTAHKFSLIEKVILVFVKRGRGYKMYFEMNWL